MTQPFDPLDPPNIGLGLRAGMFSGAVVCPGCGFATSDASLYDCPGCGRVWREKPAEQPKPLSEYSEDELLAALERKREHGDLDSYIAVVERAPEPTSAKRKRRRKRKRKPASGTPMTTVDLNKHEAEALEDVLETLE